MFITVLLAGAKCPLIDKQGAKPYTPSAPSAYTPSAVASSFEKEGDAGLHDAPPSEVRQA